MLLIKVLEFYDLLELRNILTATFLTLTKAIFLFCENVPITVLAEFENIVFTHQKNLLSGSESSNLL